MNGVNYKYMARRRIFDPVGDSAYQKVYRANHKEKIAAYSSAYTKTHREEIKKKRGPYREANLEKIRRQVWANKLKSRYGLTPAQYEELMRQHEGSCAICGSKEKLVVDHNHTTKKVRGLLCKPCNWGIGSFYEKSELFESAITYLKERN